MKMACPGTRLSRMLMDNVSLGVKFGTTLGNSFTGHCKREEPEEDHRERGRKKGVERGV